MLGSKRVVDILSSWKLHGGGGGKGGCKLISKNSNTGRKSAFQLFLVTTDRDNLGHFSIYVFSLESKLKVALQGESWWGW